MDITHLSNNSPEDRFFQVLAVKAIVKNYTGGFEPHR
jgi:hypothetical protein